MASDDHPTSGAGQSEPEPNKNPSTVYLDSCFYLDYLQGDKEYHAALEGILEAWRAGLIHVYTSALTIAEVLWVKCDDESVRVMIDPSREPDILDLFDFYSPRKFTLVEVDRRIAEAARAIVWGNGIRPKDAIHVASALAVGAEVLFTTDKKMLANTRKVGGKPVLRIERAVWTKQGALPEAAPTAPPWPPSSPDQNSASASPQFEDREPAPPQMKAGDAAGS